MNERNSRLDQQLAVNLMERDVRDLEEKKNIWRTGEIGRLEAELMVVIQEINQLSLQRDTGLQQLAGLRLELAENEQVAQTEGESQPIARVRRWLNTEIERVSSLLKPIEEEVGRKVEKRQEIGLKLRGLNLESQKWESDQATERYESRKSGSPHRPRKVA